MNQSDQPGQPGQPEQPADSNAPSPAPLSQDGQSPSPQKPQSSQIELEQAADASDASSEPAAGSTFDLQDVPDTTAPPRYKPPKVVIAPVDDEPEPPKWPDVLAIVCMGLGGVGLFLHLLEIVGFGLAIFGLWEQLGRPEKDQQSYFYLIPALILAITAFLFAGLLFYGGLSLYKRWPWCTNLLKLWAMVKILLVILLSMLGWAVLIMPVYHMFAGDKPKTDWGHYKTAFQLLWSFVWLIWELLLPAFILFWFAKKSTQEVVRSWE